MTAKSRFLFPLSVLRILCLAGVLALAGHRSAWGDIKVDNLFDSGLRTDAQWWHDGGDHPEYERITRMGMAIYGGISYYAVCEQDGGILVAPTGSSKLDDAPLASESFRIKVTTSRLYVAGLLVSNGLLYVVYFPQFGDHLYVQALRSKADGSRQVVAAADAIALPSDDPKKFTNVMPVVGDRGLYVHTISRQPNTAYAFVTTYLVRRNELVKIADTKTPDGAFPHQPTISDAVTTHEVDPTTSAVSEVHYLVWGTANGQTVLLSFRVGVGDGQYGDFRKFDDPRDNSEGSLFDLMETTVDGDETTSSTPYGLTLVEYIHGRYSINRGRTRTLPTDGSTLGGYKWIKLSVPGSVDDPSVFPNAITSVGIDKGYVADTSPKKRGGDFGFLESLRLRPRFALIWAIPRSANWTFKGGQFRGNQVVSLPGKSIKTADTAEALDQTAPASEAAAWTLLGVMHGVPPYSPYEAGKPYPTVTYNVGRTQTDAHSVTITTEDSWEVSGGFTGGGLPKEGFGGSLEFSYSHSLKTTDTSVDSTTTTHTQNLNITTVPANYAPEYNPAAVGVVLYSAPKMASKSYLVKRWDGGDFPGPTRYLFFTKVVDRKLEFLHYLIDAPEKGPLETMPRQLGEENPLAGLTQGMLKVNPVDDLNFWRHGPEDNVDYSDAYDLFTLQKSGNLNLPESVGSTLNFTLSYGTSTSEAKTEAKVHTNKETLKVTLGIKDFFVFSGSSTTTQAFTYSETNTNTFAVTEGFSGTIPALRPPLRSMSVTPLLVFGKTDKDGNPLKDARRPSWVPTLSKDRGEASFLLTWQVSSVTAPRFGRKPWKLPGYGTYYPGSSN